jgi:hypothetical protein
MSDQDIGPGREPKPKKSPRCLASDNTITKE